MAQQALIVYYSQFNNTTKLAKLIQDATKAPALRLRVADSVYPNNMEATGRMHLSTAAKTTPAADTYQLRASAESI